MTILDVRPQDAAQQAGDEPDTKFTLADLVGDVPRFMSEVWRRKAVRYRASADLTKLISEQEIWDYVDCGLLIRPYFVSFNEGVRSALSEITQSRSVVGHDVPGYINSEQVKADFAAGGTFKLNQPEHWHERLHTLVDGLSPSFQAELESYVFLSPPDRTAIETHMDGSHVFVLQVAGRKDWTVGLLDSDSLSVSDRYRGQPLTEETTLRVTLEPGDVLYMPHGSPHHATARDGNSIHVAVTVEEPTPKDLAEVMLASVLREDRFADLQAGFHQRRPAGNAALMRSLVAGHVTAQSPSEVLDRTVGLRRSHWK